MSEQESTKELETVKYTKADAIATIMLNRPHRLNAVSEQLYDELISALDKAEADSEVRVVILTGAGRAFCVGADLKEHGKGERTSFERRNYLIKANNVCTRIRTLNKPVIAAVNGFALGAGAEMAVSSDFILIKESSLIGFPEVSIGTFVGGGVTLILPQLVGLGMARELIFGGEKINGTKAHEINLATRVFPDDTFNDEVTSFAMKISKKAPISMEFAKRLLNDSISIGYNSTLATELEALNAVMMTEDWVEGVEAFSQRREPKFVGK
jgi:enoyl-CoA hydratase